MHLMYVVLIWSSTLDFIFPMNQKLELKDHHATFYKDTGTLHALPTVLKR